MDALNFIHIKHQNAMVICQVAELKEEARVLLRNSTSCAQYFSQLLEKELYSDAVRFLAHALLKREAAFWACLCVRHSLTPEALPEEVNALELAEAWVQNMDEKNRKLTMPAAVATGFKTPASWAAVAVFWSGNQVSVARETDANSEDMSAKAVITAITLSASHHDAEQTTRNYQLFLQQGVAIACGVIAADSAW